MKETAAKLTAGQLLIVIMLGILSAMGPFSIDMYLPAFPAIARGLNTSLDAVQLSLASYFVGISAGQLLYGPITDRFGRKKPLYVGLVIYALASAGCALSAGISHLIFFRLLQALGGCAGMVVSRAVVRDLFKPHESAKVYSMLMLVMGVAPIIAPSIGGFVTEALGWRSIFVVLGVISISTLAAVAFFLPESKQPDQSVRLNIKAIGIRYGQLLRQPMFIFYALCNAFGSAGMFAYISSAPFVYMELFGFSERAFGIIFSVNAAGLIFCSQLNRIFLKYYNMSTLLKNACLAFMTIGILILATAIFWHEQLVIAVLIFLFVSCLGFIYPNSTALVLAETGAQSGTASALLGALQMFISFIASVAVSALFNGTIFPVVIIMCLCGLAAFSFFSLAKGNTLKMLESAHLRNSGK